MANYTKQEERKAWLHAEFAKANSPAKRQRTAPGRSATIGEELRGPRKWIWFECKRCGRRVPRALAPYAIRTDMDVLLTDLASIIRCASCGHHGALMQIPQRVGIGADMEIEPFPAALATRGLENWISRVTRTRCPAIDRCALTNSTREGSNEWRN